MAIPVSVNNRGKWFRYFYALMMILAMVGVAEWTGEKEVIFPEMAALTVGMWIVDKRVWKVSRLRMLILMTVGAVAGVCIARYSPFPLLVNIAISFVFTAFCLMLSRTTLIPQISACMLPVLLGTESWVYPSAVFAMSVIVVCGQYLMERGRLRQTVVFKPDGRDWKKETWSWVLLLVSLLIIAFIPVYTSMLYFILPPLIVTYAELAYSKAGFRNRPVQIWLLLVVAAILGTGFQMIGYHILGIPETVVALCIFLCLFGLYEWLGKYFAPAGAIALIPMIVPQEHLVFLPLQVAAGAFLFIGTAMLLFMKCYKWPRVQLIVCLIPAPMRFRHSGNKKRELSK